MKKEKKMAVSDNRGLPSDAMLKNLHANEGDTRDMGSIPGSGRPPGGENGNPF